MEHRLPQLPYTYDALEPYIDAKTMEIHYTKHHQKYVDELNAALMHYPDLQLKPLEQILKEISTYPNALATTLLNNGGGHLNHTFFWQMLKKNGGVIASSSLAQEIAKTFGSIDAFKVEFNTAAKKVFGSGWAWLCVNQAGKLVITSTPNQNPPILQGLSPVIGLDVWEHAYYLLYQNRRPDYIDAWWHVINWDQAEDNYREIMRKL